MTTAFTLAHLTDVHLGPIVGFAPSTWNLKRATGYLNWRLNRRKIYLRTVLDRLVADLKAQRPNHIAVTGDLVNIGLPKEIELAQHWLAALGSPESVSVVPGNHDIYASMGSDRGVRRWSSYMSSNAAGQSFVGEVEFPYVRVLGSIALVGLNSALPQPPLVAAGELGAAQIERLAGILERLAAEDLVRVVLIHHPPLPGLATRRHDLTDAKALAGVLAQAGAELVLHGHNHQNMLHWAPGPDRDCPVVGLPAASLGLAHKDEPFGRYNLYHIEGRQIMMVGRGLTEADGPIVEIERKVLTR